MMSADNGGTAKGWVFLDLDRTFTTCSTEPILTKALWRAGWCSTGQMTLVGWQYVRYRLHMISDFDQTKRRVVRHLFKGKPVSELEAAADACFREQLLPAVRAPLAEEINNLRSHGFRVALLTSTLDLTARRFVDHFNFDAMLAAELEIANGTYTGEIVNDIPYGEGKLRAARQHLQGLGVDLHDCYAYGDRFEDCFLLDKVGHPFAVAPDRKLKRIASERGWPIVHLTF